MEFSVSKRRIFGVVLVWVCTLVLVMLHLDMFLEKGAIKEDMLSVVLFLFFCGCYVQSVQVKFYPWINRIWMGCSFVGLSCLCVAVIEYLSGNTVTDLTLHFFVLNVLCCVMLYLLLFALTNQYRWTVVIGTTVGYVIGVVNYFVLMFRSSPFQLTDIGSVGTAADVAGNYVIGWNYELLVSGSILFFAVCVAMVGVYHQKRRTWKQIGCSMVLLLMFISSVHVFYQDAFWEQQTLEMNFWNPLQGYKEHGTALSLAMEAKYLRPEKPEHYSAGRVEEILMSAIQAQEVSAEKSGDKNNVEEEKNEIFPIENLTTKKSVMPNIIVIMNESYADLSVLGEFKTSIPYMSFYRSLQKNTIRGNLSVSVLGGGTCNSEFEFLTGLTTAFLPSGSMAYQQYIHQDLDSMASILKTQGYKTVAFHPGKADSWQRDKIYPLLGFDTFLTEKDMDHPTYMREAYVTDSSDYEEVIRLFEEKGEEKLFLFNVTIQNHGGYQLNTVDIPKWVSLCGTERYPETEQYLSIMHASDEALQELISYFEKEKEPTMIVFFGDHQPSVESAFVESLLGKSLKNLSMEEVQKRYKVPFFIWTNYDIEEKYYENISANYLSTLVLKLAGARLPIYHQYLDQLQKTVPMINALGYMDAKGTYHYFSEQTEETEILQEYKMVQYNDLFGGKKRLSELYAVSSKED